MAVISKNNQQNKFSDTILIIYPVCQIFFGNLSYFRKPYICRKILF